MSVLFMLLLVALAAVLQWLSREHCLDGLRAEVGIDRHVAECGENFTLITSVVNPRRLPVFFLHLSEQVPLDMRVELVGTGVVRLEAFGSGATLEQTTYVMPRQRLTRTLTASIPRRGRYTLQDVTLQAGDFLGLEERDVRFPTYREIVILPTRADMVEFEPAFGKYLGDISVRRFILSDPILTAGFREYTGREPQRDISWPQSLRNGRLMVRQYDYTSERTATVMVNVFYGNREEIERCCSVARSVCEKLEEKRITYSFLTNACVTSSAGRWSYIGDGLGPRHLDTILEGLGSVTYGYLFPLSQLLEQAGTRREEARGFILITPALAAADMAQVRRLERETGQRVLILSVSETEAVSCD